MYKVRSREIIMLFIQRIDLICRLNNVWRECYWFRIYDVATFFGLSFLIGHLYSLTFIKESLKIPKGHSYVMRWDYRKVKWGVPLETRVFKEMLRLESLRRLKWMLRIETTTFKVNATFWDYVKLNWISKYCYVWLGSKLTSC